jgi:copper chaperone CopZ
VRGALEELPGVGETEIAPGERDVVVRFDPARTSVAQLLDGLAAAGQPARAK